jgi:hypothetical protein
LIPVAIQTFHVAYKFLKHCGFHVLKQSKSRLVIRYEF